MTDSPLPQASKCRHGILREQCFSCVIGNPLEQPESTGLLPLSDAEQHPYDDEELEGAREAIEEFGDPWYPSARLLATIDRLRADLTAAQEAFDRENLEPDATPVAYAAMSWALASNNAEKMVLERNLKTALLNWRAAVVAAPKEEQGG